MATQFPTHSKSVSCTSSSQDQCVCWVSSALLEKWGSSSIHKISPDLLNNMPLPWQRSIRHIQKVDLAHLHPHTNVWAKFLEHCSKNEEVVQSTRFPLIYYNMSLPWQRSIWYIQKVGLAHLHPNTNVCAQFHENCSKNEEVVWSSRFYPDLLQ